MSFYVKLLRQLIATGKLDPHAPTLVVAGGQYDRDCLAAAGFTNVVISNLDTRMNDKQFEPYKWQFLDAENLKLEDKSFAQVIEHAGLHHCGSPHRGLLEMCRVATAGVLVFENRDSALMRLASLFGLVPAYELEAVAGNQYQFGGYRNTAVPNFIYRWTEREVIKTISAAEPTRRPQVSFFYNLRLPTERLEMHVSSWKSLTLKVLAPFIALIAMTFPKQANEFAFFLDLGQSTRHPWIDPELDVMTSEYGAKSFKAR